MKKYKYLQLFVDSHLQIYSTDDDILKWVISELKNIYPDCIISKNRAEFLGKIHYVQFEKLRSRDEEIGWWLMDQLGKKGWEPFAVTADAGQTNIHYHFRLETLLD